MPFELKNAIIIESDYGDTIQEQSVPKGTNQNSVKILGVGVTTPEKRLTKTFPDINNMFSEVVYRGVYFFAYLVSLLSMRFLYSMSFVGYIIIYHVFSYRKFVVIQNISRSFPDKKYPEIECIVKQFYRSFTDHFVEIIKTISISPQKLRRKVKFVNSGIIEKHISQGRNVFAFTGHCGNWEMLNVIPLIIPVDTYAVYKPLQNKAFDKLMHTLRSRFGIKMISDKSIAKHLLSNKTTPSLYLFLADQCPRRISEKYSLTFLNQQTNMFYGAEKLSRMTNSVSVYVNIIQLTKRGKYRIEFIPMCSQPLQTSESDITREYARLLEENIREEPYSWLWSHKRWKR